MAPITAAGRWRATAVVLVAAIILVVRKTDAFTNPQFWAEDFMFLLNAQDHGFGALFTPFAGYLHALPRVIAAIGARLDPVLQPGLYVFFSFALTLAVVAHTLSPRLRLPGREWLALAVVVVPHNGEVYLNPTNLQWITAVALLVTACEDDAVRPRDWVVDVCSIVLAGLTGPFIVFFFPLFLIRALRRQTRASWTILALVTLVAAPQGWEMLHDKTPPEGTGPWHPGWLVAKTSWRLICQPLFGQLWPASAGMISTGVTGVLLFSGIVFFATREKAFRVEALLLVLALVILLAASAVRKRIDLWLFRDLTGGDRYLFLPKLLVLWLLIIIATAVPNRWLRGVAIALLMLSVATNAQRFRFRPYVDYHWYQLCDELRAGHAVKVTINPGTEYPYRRP